MFPKHAYYDAGQPLQHDMPDSLFYTYFVKNQKKIICRGGHRTYTKKKNGYDFMIHRNKTLNRSTIYFIGKKQECIAAKILDKHKKDEIHITTFSYFEHCSEGAKLPKYHGARIMMQVFLAFLKKKGFKRVTLSDSSFIICKQGGKVSLSEYYFFKYGYLYYQSHGFEFYHTNEETMNMLRSKWQNIRNQYWNHRKITPTFLKKYKHYAKTCYDIFNKTDECYQIYDELKKYRSVSSFLKHYHFVSCYVLRTFLIFLKYYYHLDSILSEYCESFILYL
jgi:hypothetical protein